MSDDNTVKETEVSPEKKLPEAQVHQMRNPFPLIWLIPLVAACFAGYLLYQQYQGLGPKILVKFRDVDGLKPGESPVHYRGVSIGLVTKTMLDPKMEFAIAEIRLKRSAESVAKKGSTFWIVRPEVAQNSITGLGTIFSGPYVNVDPGEGEPETEFTGQGSEPASVTGSGLRLKLRTASLGQVSLNARVYYRGVQVGSVESIGLTPNSQNAEVDILIKRPYSRLVTPASKFWSVSGADLTGSLFTGLDLKVESVRSLVAGGIAFATPSSEGVGTVRANGVFELHEKPDDDWREWAPKITLSEAQMKQSQSEEQAESAKTIGPALIKKEK